MSATFAAFFIQHADCLSPAEKAQALQEAADALRAKPGVSFRIREALFTRGELQPSPDDTPDFEQARDAAIREWSVRAVFVNGGIQEIIRELSDAAQALAAQHELCPTHWCWVGDCDHAADAADRAHDRYRTEGCD